MTIYRSRLNSQSWAGETIGILVFDCFYPFIPGNVANATTYNFPVRYAVVEGVTNDRLIYDRDPRLIKPFVAAAQKLEAEGVRAITFACGFMALFQRELAESVNIPVFASSLLQIPFIYQITGKRIGVISADSSMLTSRHLENCGIPKNMPLAIAGMQDVEAFAQAIFRPDGTLDDAAIRKGTLEVTQDLLNRHNDIGSILLECSDLPPYAADVQALTGLPVFDFVTMINFVHESLARRPYSGAV